ncbi:MAG: hypothetical protein OHK0045_21230 [Raineya sp.]
MRTFTKILFITLLSTSSFTLRTQNNIPYQAVKGYNFVGDDQNVSDLFLVIECEKEWNKYFKPLPGHYVKEITTIDWTKYVAIATVKSGNEAWALQAKRVELDEGELYFEYEATKTDTGLNWKNATPLIVLIPKKNYKSILYIENGSLIRKIHNFTGKRDF